ncbi:MAG: VCBS repeat-containing protein [Caldilineaceae bacterium]|nr:VCBS repeat-containing protein [Caldilineaceae bacterium]
MRTSTVRTNRILRAGILLALLLLLTVGSGASSDFSRSLYAGEGASTTADEAISAQMLLGRTLDRIQSAEGYEIQVNVDQILTPERSFFGPAGAESAHFEINGKINGPKRARLTIHSGRTSFGMNQQEPQELLLVGSSVYQRQGERWVRVDNGMPMMGIGPQGISLAAAARDVIYLEAEAGPPGLEGLTTQYKRIGFRLDPEDVRRQLLAQQGSMDASAYTLAELQMPVISGSGELWVTPSGHPDRLILRMGWARGGDEPIHVGVTSETVYIGFGSNLTAQHFDPERSPVDGSPRPELAYLDWLRPSLIGAVILGLLGFLWLLRRAQTGARLALRAVTVLLIAALIVPYTTPVIEAARSERTQSAPSATRAGTRNEWNIIAEQRKAAIAEAASGLDAFGDEDGDGLPNGYELTLGTNPFTADTDFDGLTDAQEVLGIECAGKKIYSDPLNPDSNHDGLLDGQEFWRGQCHKNNTNGWIWDDDNDGDKVPDGLDLSPFSNSMAEGFKGGFYPGANFTFESMDMDADPSRTVIYPFYVEVQLRPTNPDSLRWAYKHLYWPGDTLGAIQNTDPVVRFISELKGSPVGSSGKLTLTPFLSATVREADLPSASARSLYGVNYTPKKDDNGNPVLENNKPLYELTMPLAPVERGGQIYAFQSRMLHDQNGNVDLERRWKDVRLKWAVIGDVLMLDDTINKAIPSPNGGYGLVVYDESYYITGLQVSRQGGASMLVAAAQPPASGPYDDGLMTLLRAGMEARFLPGDLSMAEIKQRFNAPSSATLEQRWGIPNDKGFRVEWANYQHVDQALATTAMTTTKQILSEVFGLPGDINPSLIFASEQRTSTVNLDDDPTKNYQTVTLNTCLKPLITSRTLKLQTYHKVTLPGDLFGTWEPMDLDQVLAHVEKTYAQATNANYQYYYEELSILKLAATSWFLGQTSVTAIGQFDMISYHGAFTMSDALVVKYLTNQGVLSEGMVSAMLFVLKVLEKGPVKWLKDTYTDVMEVYDGAKKLFEGSYTNYGPPDSYIKVIPMPGEGGGLPPEPGMSFSDFLKYTDKALTVLSILATILDFFYANEIGKVLKIATKIIKIGKNIKGIIDSVTFAVEMVGKSKEVVQEALSASKELTALSKPFAVVGLVLAIGTIWAVLIVQLWNVGPGVALGLVLRAIVETVLLVALFVIGTLFPYGTIVALAIGIIRLIESLIGFTFDPLSLLIDFLFGVKVYERVEIVGQPQIGAISLEPRQPGGGVISGRTFRLKLPSQIVLGTVNDGTKSDLEKAHAQVHIGRFGNGSKYTLCTPSPQLFEEYKRSLDGFVTGTFLALETDCVYFRLPSFVGMKSGGEVSKTAPQKTGNVWKRTVNSLAWVDVNPGAAINGRLLLDVSMDVKIPYDECTTVGGCDRYYAESTSAPGVSEFFMDILPGTVKNLWTWDAISNYDPDGDGLTGYEAYPGFWVGPDANLCPNILGNSALTWDTDGDGLSDKFELETPGFDPCRRDTDGDGVDDYMELMLGTDPSKKDTDGDGLTDGEETAFNNGFNMVFPWTVQMNNLYPGLPNPYAFPNPLMANSDSDYRNDKMEKARQSSPHAYNAIPVGEALGVYIGQGLQPGGVTSIYVSTSAWQNIDTGGIEPTLTVTLPVAFSNVTSSAKVDPPIWWFDANTGTPQPTGNPNVFRWKLPMLSLNRYATIQISGVPVIPSGPVSITAQLVYTEGAKLQISTAEIPLLINTGGPRTEIVGVTGGVILENGVAAAGAQASLYASANTPLIVQGIAEDPDRVGKVFVCLVASGPCAAGDWKEANGTESWSYSFNSPTDGAYLLRAYGVDSLGVSGQAHEVNVGVDTSPPASLTLDLEGTVYLKTQTEAISARNDADGEPPFVILSGQVGDKTGAAFVSGVDKVGVVVNGEQYYTVDVDNPGAASSPFHFKWSPPAWARGDQGQYEITVAGQDRAGNSGATDSVTLIIDDMPPVVHTALPQVSASTAISLSGRADDTGLLLGRQPQPTFAQNLTLANSATQFTTGVGKALIVGDLNGDTIDDVLLLLPTGGLVPQPLQAGIFFGKPGGLPAVLAVANADVKLNGEGPTGLVADGAAAGDVNGDGIGDLLIGDPGLGTAYLILGRRGAWPATLNLANANWKLTQAGSAGFGGSVAGAGDVDGDGLADILVGATSQGAINGPVWLYAGREQGTPAAVRLFHASRATAGAPQLAGLGDATGDGLSDFVIAAQGVPVALVAGRPASDWPVGNINLITDGTAQFSGNSNGATVAAAGDVNGDGLQDLLVGDPNAATPRLYLIHGRRNFPGSATLSAAAAASFAPGTAPNSRLGAGMVSLGDVDGDGRADFAFGQPGNGGGPNRAALIMTAGIDLTPNMSINTVAASLISGGAASQLLGAYISAGDVNGDGIVDILVGAGGEGRAYLFRGAYAPGAVAGIQKVEIGFAGPNLNSATPVTATLPATWQTATLGQTSGGISAWQGQLTVPGNGDYRIYVRATDKAGNLRGNTTWYVGNVWVNTAPTPFATSSVTMNVPTLTNKTDLSLSGNISSVQTPQMVRVYDGYKWHRLAPATGNWSLLSTIPRHDLYTDHFRVVGRDRVGNQIHAARTLAVDTLVAAPVISTTMPVNQWQTGSPSLGLNWPALADASGITNIWAVINTSPLFTPTTAVAGNAVTMTLNAAGTYYGHVRVRDSAGNESMSRIGPFLVNRAQTPSTLLVDGVMDMLDGEYPAGTLLNYDPYAAIKPAALWGTWNASQISLGFPGNAWGTANKLAFYLDTKNGGLTNSLNLFGNVHTLPFAADYALIVGGEPDVPFTIYRATGGNWSPVANAVSRAVLGIDTEIALNRAEIEATGGLGMLAYAENADGVWAVLPGGARADIEPNLTGALTFADKLSWAALGNNVQPAAGQNQIHAPVITVLPAVQNVLPAGQGTSFQMLIHNPDVGPYVNVLVSVTVDAPMSLVSVSGATCSSCPAGGRSWDLLANVAAGGTQTVTVNAQMGGADLRGVFPLGINTRMSNSGLISKPQPPTSGHYLLDQGVAVVNVMASDRIQYRQPGQVEFQVFPNLDLTEMGRCLSLVEVNTGSGWNSLCQLGLCDVIVANIPAGGIQDWQIRVDGGNGRFSDIEHLTVIADSIAPTVEIANTTLLSGTLGFIEGLAWDGFPTTRAPQRVEVSINGGRFLPAAMSKPGRTAQRNGAETAVWRMPVSYDGWDGQAVNVVARAVDEAGNISTPSAPISITLDSMGPSIAITQTERLLAGTVKDGSGVATVEISLDGGNSYQSAERRGENVSFDLSAWRGGAIQTLAMVRAADLHGNLSHAIVPITTLPPLRIYLPSVQRSGGGREGEIDAAQSETEAQPAETSADAPATESAEESAEQPATGTSQIYLPAVSSGLSPADTQGSEPGEEGPPAEESTEE